LSKRCARSPLRSKLHAIAAQVQSAPPQIAQLKMQRPTCTRCLRAQTTCICHWITPIEHQVEVLILQHPMEVHEAKGSARLLHLCLPRSRMVTGEMFDGVQLQAWLTEPFPEDALLATALCVQPTPALRHPVLLYPATPLDATLGDPPTTLTSEQLGTPSLLRLVVLDGTWRKSRKILHLNPLLQQLPRLVLRKPPAPRYLIRKAQQSHQLSTLEATCAALDQLEGDAAAVVPLLTAFDGFVAQQLAHQQ
jgi:DTW domain-containing protein